MLETLQNKDYWNKTWQSYFDHYQQDLRHSYYINAFLNPGEKKILEMGAGSFRDFANLNKLGIDCYAFDYCEHSVNKAKEIFFNLSHKIFIDNAFSTKFKDREFDFTFHNGVWGCFDDEQILLLAKEQMRISKKRFSFTLHNAHNEQFIEYFKKLAAKDPMYTVRFFSCENIYALLKKLHVFKEQIKIYPVGKGKKFHEDLLIEQGKHDAKSIYCAINDAKLNYLNSSERLLCIVTM